MTTHDEAPRLVLWDIDHTLMETRGLGIRLYRQAFHTVTGVPVQHHIEVTGRTEQAIFADALRMHGLEPADDLQERYVVELAKQYAEHSNVLGELGRALPGAKEALIALAEQPGVIQTVLTGNVRAVAITKLRVFELAEHIDFEIGAYGDDDSERAKLVAVAQRRAGQEHGAEFGQDNTVIVGDTVQDVVAARQGGALIVGVASGQHGIDDLQRAGAEIVLADLTDTARVVEAVTKVGLRF